MARRGRVVATALATTLVTALLVGGGPAQAADATISLSPDPVAPDGTLTVVGTGCPADSPVSLRVFRPSGGTNIDRTTSADGLGGFTDDVPLANTYPVGSEIGVVVFCGDLFADVPSAADFVYVALPDSAVALSVTPSRPRYGDLVVASVVTTPTTAPGAVHVRVDGEPAGSTGVVAGTATLGLGRLPVGRHAIEVVFQPAATGADPVTAARTVVVRKAVATTTLTPARRVVDRGTPVRARLAVVCSAATPVGRVAVRDGRHRVRLVRLRARHHGRVTVVVRGLRPGRHRLSALYLGSPTVRPDASPSRVVLVRR